MISTNVSVSSLYSTCAVCGLAVCEAGKLPSPGYVCPQCLESNTAPEDLIYGDKVLVSGDPSGAVYTVVGHAELQRVSIRDDAPGGLTRLCDRSRLIRIERAPVFTYRIVFYGPAHNWFVCAVTVTAHGPHAAVELAEDELAAIRGSRRYDSLEINKH